MAESLRDQLLKSGLVKQVQQNRAQQPQRQAPSLGAKAAGKPGKPSRPALKESAGGDIDLAKAYAIRAQSDANERKRVEREAAEQARLRRERKLQIQRLLDGKALNKADADQPRSFEYGGKIRRVYVDGAQLAALNAGELGVVQLAGRYLLVSREVAEQVRSLDAHLLALLVDPSAPSIGDDGVPDDLMW